jgi:hypothetical protein
LLFYRNRQKIGIPGFWLPHKIEEIQISQPSTPDKLFLCIMVFVFSPPEVFKLGNYFKKLSILFLKSFWSLFIYVEKLLLALCPSE